MARTLAGTLLPWCSEPYRTPSRSKLLHKPCGARPHPFSGAKPYAIDPSTLLTSVPSKGVTPLCDEAARVLFSRPNKPHAARRYREPSSSLSKPPHDSKKYSYVRGRVLLSTSINADFQLHPAARCSLSGTAEGSPRKPPGEAPTGRRRS